MLKYLEIDSTYRNRKEFPNPTRFDVITAQNGTQFISSSSISPISLAAPIVTYVPISIDNIVLGGAGLVEPSEADSPTTFILRFPIGLNVNRTSDYYRGIQMQIDAGATNLGRHTIQSCEYLNTVAGNDCFRIDFSPSLDPITNPYSTIDSLSFISSTDFTLGNVFIPNGSAAYQTYKGWYVYNETQNLYTPILAYDGNFSLAHTAPQATWLLTDNISIRQEVPRETGTFQAGSTNISVVLAATANPTANSLIGSFLRITQSGLNKNQICDITSYAGSPTFVATLNCVLPVAPLAGNTYEILNFSNDGFVPLNYSGTHTTQEVCYELQLVNLTVPNVGVKTGGILTSYPYLYVDFQNYTTSSGGSTNVIYSNNPNATRRLFRIPVSDHTPPSINSFLKLDKCYMAQIVRITPYNSFKFGLFLPDGRPLEFDINDTTPPTAPNPALQVSALFSLKRLS